jgi:hypothetical protein
MDTDLNRKLNEQNEILLDIKKHLGTIEAGLKLIFTIVSVVGVFVSIYVLKKL